MKLYHGTNAEFETIDLTKSHRYKDFGQGFYLTDIRRQAVELAQKRAMIMGGQPIVMEFEIESERLNDGTLNVLRFENPSAEWAEFIFKNRSRRVRQPVHHYDVVIGPIADDGVAYLLDRYEEGSYTLSELARELEYKKLNRQYFFGTQRALECLERVKTNE